METWTRICIKPRSVTDPIGQHFTVERGQEYLTSRSADGYVTVFSTFWVRVPADIFAGEIQFTP